MRTVPAGCPGALTGAWVVDPVASRVSLAVDYALAGTVRARFVDAHGVLLLHRDVRRCRALILICAGSVCAGPPARDQWLRSAAFLDADTHPYIWFRSTGVTPYPHGRGERVVVSGELHICGVTRPIRCPIRLRVRRAAGGVAGARLTGQIRLSRSAFALGTGVDTRRGGLLLGDRVTVDLDIRAIRHLTASTALPDPAATPTSTHRSQTQRRSL